MTATWRFSDLVANDMYVIALRSSFVRDLDNSELDGEWANPASFTTNNAAVSEFPSGNGSPGGNFNFIITLLSGDYSGSNIVDSYDAYILGRYYTEQPEEAIFEWGDGNGDGVIDSMDIPFFEDTDGLDLRFVWIVSDMDGDLDVDEYDEDLFETGWMSQVQNPTWEDGDLDGDGTLDLDDIDLFYAHFGMYGLELTIVS
jgi:hypothetical protein